MIPISPDWMEQTVMVWMLIGLRMLGCFLSMPLLAYRAIPVRLKVVLALLLAYLLLPSVQSRTSLVDIKSAGYAFAVIELAIGLAAGWMVRVGLMSVDMLADVLSQQAGLSFAATLQHDPGMASGLMGEFLGMTTLALAFALNVHLVMVDVLLQSFRWLPIGHWPEVWQWDAILGLFQEAFALGLVLSLPAIVVYFLFNMTQAILARVSPQMNLFSIGFAIMVPVAFVVVALLLPAFADLVERALQAPFELIRQGLRGARAA